MCGGSFSDSPRLGPLVLVSHGILVWLPTCKFEIVGGGCTRSSGVVVVGGVGRQPTAHLHFPGGQSWFIDQTSMESKVFDPLTAFG